MICSIANRILLYAYNRLLLTAVITVIMMMMMIIDNNSIQYCTISYCTRPRIKDAQILFCLTSSFYTSTNDE